MIPSTKPSRLNPKEYYELQKRMMSNYIDLLSDRESLLPARSSEAKQEKLLAEIKRINLWLKESPFSKLPTIADYSRAMQEWGKLTGY